MGAVEPPRHQQGALCSFLHSPYGAVAHGFQEEADPWSVLGGPRGGRPYGLRRRSPQLGFVSKMKLTTPWAASTATGWSFA